MNTIAIIQSRMTSTRLPGKALLPLLGVPLILRVVERVRHVRGLTDIVVATSTDASDDPLAAVLANAHVSVFRGELHNVQQRFFDAARYYQADLIMRVTGDNPLIDIPLMQAVYDRWQAVRCDYVCCADCIPGVGAELFTMEAFCRGRSLTATAYQREHVTPVFHQNQQYFSIERVPVPHMLQPCGIKISVDTEEEYKKMVALFEKLYNNDFIDIHAAVNLLTQKGF